GRVTELLVQVGDQVTADQPLVALESPEVRSAQAEYVRAQADLTLAEKAADRAERLRAASAVSEKDYLQAKEDGHKASGDFERASAREAGRPPQPLRPARTVRRHGDRSQGDGRHGGRRGHRRAVGGGLRSRSGARRRAPAGATAADGAAGAGDGGAGRRLPAG